MAFTLDYAVLVDESGPSGAFMTLYNNGSEVWSGTSGVTLESALSSWEIFFMRNSQDWSQERVSVAIDLSAGTATLSNFSSSPLIFDIGHTLPTKFDGAHDYYEWECVGAPQQQGFELFSDVEVTGYAGVYDGQPHGVTVSGIEQGDLITYSADGLNYSSVAPTVTDVVDSKKIYVKITRLGDFIVLDADVAISRKQLSVTGTTASDKIYNGTTDAMVTLGTVSGIVAGDDVSVGVVGSFETADCGTNKTVNLVYSWTGVEEDMANYLAPIAGSATASITAAPLTAVTLSSYTPSIGTAITATPVSGDLTDVTATFQWYRGDTAESATTPIADATTASYTPTNDDLGKFLKVTATGSGNFDPTPVSAVTTLAATTAITGVVIGHSYDEVRAGEVLTATVTPANATATYQWYVGNGSITDATSSTFTPSSIHVGQTLRCVATGTGFYTGSAEATTTAVHAVLHSPTVVISGTGLHSLTVRLGEKDDHAFGFELEYSIDNASWTPFSPLGIPGDNLIMSLTSSTLYYIRAKAVGSGYYIDSPYTETSGTTLAEAVDIAAVSDTGDLSLTTVVKGGTFGITDLVLYNAGTVASGAVTVNFYASTDQTVTDEDILVGTTTLSSGIYAGANEVVDVDNLSTDDLDIGTTYYIGWIASTDNDVDLSNDTGVAAEQLFVSGGGIGVSITSYTGVYDGEAHSAALTGVLETDEVTYSLDEGVSWSVTAVSRTDVGETDYKVKVVRANYDDLVLNGHVEITAKSLTTTIAANTKTYDGSTTSTGTASLSGIVGNDDVSLSGGSYAFDSADVGTKTVTFSGYALTGPKADNYVCGNSTAAASAAISAKPLTISGSSVTSKTYDKNDAAAIVCGTVAGIVGDDEVVVTASGSFASTDAASDIDVAVTYSLSGAAAGNYDAPASETLKGTIEPIQLTVTGTTVANKTYDGTNEADVSPGTLLGVLEGDAVTLSATGTFTSSDVGDDISVDIVYTITEDEEA